MKRELASHFAGQIYQLVEQKNAVGFPYDGGICTLRAFDRFCASTFPNETALTKELCMAWAVRRPTESKNTFRNRIIPIREFARYLNRIGEAAYIIPPDFVKKGPRHMPYIYSEDEIAEFWRVLDGIKPQKGSLVQHLVIPTIFRLIYCCGLRPGEARKLRVEDVDLSRGKIYILESKGHKDRIVMMADDMNEFCRRYDKVVRSVMPTREAFFPNSMGVPCSSGWLSGTFRKMWAKVSFSGDEAARPRIYDFRHTFATHRLYLWMKEGKDLSVQLPYLSAYMGHALLSDTYYYIHLVPEQFEAMSGLDFSHYDRLLPEVKGYE